MSISARPFPIIFAAPSGAGKTTIARMLGERRTDLLFSVSATTREPREYERNGEHYHFVREDEFRRMVDAGEMLEWAEVHGNLYGTPAENLRKARAAGKHLVLDIDVQGSRQIRESVPDAVSIFVLPPSGPRLVERLQGRGSEDGAVQRRRMRNALREIETAEEFDYVVVNADLNAAVAAVEAIMRAESCRTRRIFDLAAHLTQLTEEIGACLENDSLQASDGNPKQEPNS